MATPKSPKPGAATTPAASAAPADEVSKLKAELERLTNALAERDEALAAAQKGAVSAQTLAALQQREIEEMPTGKTVKVSKVSKWKDTGQYKDNGTPIRKPEFKEVDLPTFFYRIELPPSGGTGVKINGEEFIHGATYEFDLDMLRTIKDIVHRAWAHEANIKGSNENVYRRPQNTMLRGNARSGAH